MVNTKPYAQDMGAAIIQRIREILNRCKEADARLGYPGEGGERSFRHWLTSDLLIGLLGWPADKIVIGERFDILLQDTDGFPIITIETKTPYHKASKKEREEFESRLSGFGTLRTAYFTNGLEWESLDIFSPTGALEIRSRREYHLEKASTGETEAFFAPLFADRHFGGVARTSRHAVSRENIHILEALAADLDQIIDSLAYYFENLFLGLHEGKAGIRTGEVTLALFNLWCEKSLIVKPENAARHLSQAFSTRGLTHRDISKELTDLGFTGPAASAAAEAIAALSNEKKVDPEPVAEALWPAYQSAISNLCAQTAHVILGRALLYRVGEDQGVFPRNLSGEQMEHTLTKKLPTIVEAPLPATELISRVRLSMQGFLPIVYQLGEFDWWQVFPEKRAALQSAELSWLRQRDSELERIIQGLLRMLNGYFFGRVDVDVWRNIYQHYMPPDERQRLGGFYTPDELVNLVLDLMDYLPQRECLCKLSFIDPACGSGAFVTTALSRLLAHLEMALPCHAHIKKRGIPRWKRDEEVIHIATALLHSVDVHPFAAFLTTLNTLFLLLPFYVKVREKNPDFSLNLSIFSADALEKPDEDRIKGELFESLNARIQLSEESLKRYQAIIRNRFDFVFGNPPWGGVLKGPLAPVYDSIKKRRFAQEFRSAAQGKYDIYGLFMERALQMLKPAGRFGLLTQGSYIDKEWARGLRKLLSTRAAVRTIVDLNPFGHLFFRRMNIPCLTVGDNLVDEKGVCRAVLSTMPRDFKDLSEKERRARVAAAVRQALQKISKRREIAIVDFARASQIPLSQLKATADGRWNLASRESAIEIPLGWLTAADLFEMRQGVTPGGCLDIFLMTEELTRSLELETELVHKAIKSKEVGRWRVEWHGRALFYPYILTSEGPQPAFSLKPSEVKDKALAEAMRQKDVLDALDFDKPLDRREEEIVHRRGVNRETVGDLLKHRIALGLVNYRKAAQYLTDSYERLEGRVFKKKNIRDFNRRWYEYLWPRDPHIMLGKPRIVSPTLLKRVRFALDTVGYISDHACLFIQPHAQTANSFKKLLDQLSSALARGPKTEDGLKYCLAFLNSNYAQGRLVTGHRPTPKGFYAITENYLNEIPIPPPDPESAPRIINLVERLILSHEERETARLEADLAELIDPILP